MPDKQILGDWADEMARTADKITSQLLTKIPEDWWKRQAETRRIFNGIITAALRKAVAQHVPKDAMDAARQIGLCASQAGISVLKLDDPEDWKRAVADVKKYTTADERERCAKIADAVYGPEAELIAARIRGGE